MEYEKKSKRSANLVIRILPILPLNSYKICYFFVDIN